MSKTYVQCPNGHFYYPDESTECPYCSGESANPSIFLTNAESQTVPLPADYAQTGAVGMQSNKKTGGPTVPPKRDQIPVQQEGATVPVTPITSCDPVVGWLICVEGKDRGTDYRLHDGINYIGRDVSMDVCIHADNKISRLKQAWLAYSERKRRFLFGSGEGRNIVYLNDEELIFGQSGIQAYDRVQMGDTTLMFIPACGEDFDWGDAASDEGGDAVKRCPQGHYYKSSEYASCPICAGISADMRRGPQLDRRPDFVKAQDTMSGAATYPPQRKTVPVTGPGFTGSAAPSGDDGQTVAVVYSEIGIDPVVGWFLCLDGAEKGRDYRIYNGVNYIGRDAKMDICVRGDEQISREKQAWVAYSNTSKRFLFGSGDGRNIVFLNDEEIIGGQSALKAYDKIRLGKTTLMFFPACGERFDWTPQKDG